MVGGAADLAGSCLTKLKFEGAGEFMPPESGWGDYGGRNFRFGIREHCMGSVCNGLALCGLRPFCSTFLVFSDYMKPPIRWHTLTLFCCFCVDLLGCFVLVAATHRNEMRKPHSWGAVGSRGVFWAWRLSAIMEIPSIWVFTHDSVGVGEDGPTHQPIEQLSALRSIPGLLTFRPCDANEALNSVGLSFATCVFFIIRDFFAGCVRVVLANWT
eukprot:4922867-Amphidinium_carterae.1